MRVIAGTAGGIRLNVPKAMTRPTTDRVREAIFSSLGDRVREADVLDLYAGSGALGIEALSRGARSVIFVDEKREACDAIEANLEKARLEGGTTRQRKVAAFLRGLGNAEAFDLIFADPPYARNAAAAEELEALLESDSLTSALRESGFFVLESSASSALPETRLWETGREKKYGGTRVSFLTRQGAIGG